MDAPGQVPDISSQIKSVISGLQGLADNLNSANEGFNQTKETLRRFADANDSAIRNLRAMNSEASNLSEAQKDLAEKIASEMSARSGALKILQQEKVIRGEQIKNLEQQGKYFSAGLKKFIDRFKSDDLGKRAAVAQASGALIKTAKDPEEAIMAIAGPWAILLKMIIDTVDNIRKTASELHKASAASGNFANGMNKARAQAVALVEQQESLARAGLTVEETTKIYTTLKNTGIEALGALDASGDALSSMAKATVAFSKASGEEMSAVTNRFASFIRNFGVAVGDVSSQYSTILADATNIAQEGIMTTADYMRSVESLGEAFADVGINIGEVSHLVREVGKSMKSMGLAQKDIQSVAQGIMGLTKAADGWKVMMSKMSGVQGGFAESLYSFEQRGEGFDLTKMGKKDIGAMVGQGQSMLNQMTGGISDAATRRLIQEQIGGQIGMDPKTLQVFQKLESGAISQEEAGTSIEKLWDEAKKNNLSSKDMLENLKNFLTGWIAKPIAGIYKVLTLGMGKTPFDDEKEAVKSASVGATIKSGGMLRVHAEEMIVPAAKTSPYKDGGRTSISIGDITVGGGDPREVSRSVGNMIEQKIYEAMARQQKSNFVG